MYENELVMYAFNLHMLHGLTHDLTDEHMGQRVSGVGHSPRWILGHLAISTDLAAQLVGGEGRCPAAWHQAFGPGSTDDLTDAPQPSREELVAAIKRGHEQVSARAKHATPEAMSGPPPVDLFKGTPITTEGQLFTLLITVHESYHLGQLSAWRRQVGFTPLF